MGFGSFPLNCPTTQSMIKIVRSRGPSFWRHQLGYFQRSLINSRDRFTIFLRRCWSSGSHVSYVSLFVCFCCTPKKTYSGKRIHNELERSTMLYRWENSQNSNGGSFQFVMYSFTRPGTSNFHPVSSSPGLQVIGAKGIQPQTGRFLGPDPNLVDDLRNPRNSQVRWNPPLFCCLNCHGWNKTPIVFVGKNSNSELLHAGDILFFSPKVCSVKFPMQNLFEFPLLSCENPGCIPMFWPENFAKASPPNRSKTCSPHNLEVWRRTQQHSRRRGWWSFSLANLLLIVW